MRLLNSLWYATLVASAAFLVGIARSDPPKGWTADGVNVRTVTQKGKTIYEATATRPIGYLWLDGVTFREGTIEADMKGKGTFGIAYGVDSGPERVMVSPLHFGDGKAPSIEYLSPIDAGKQPHKATTASALKSPPNGDAWFRVKIDVKQDMVRVFLGPDAEASLIVDRSQKTKAGKAGLCISEGSSASFANFKVTPYDDAAPKSVLPKKRSS